MEQASPLTVCREQPSVTTHIPHMAHCTVALSVRAGVPALPHEKFISWPTSFACQNSPRKNEGGPCSLARLPVRSGCFRAFYFSASRLRPPRPPRSQSLDRVHSAGKGVGRVPQLRALFHSHLPAQSRALGKLHILALLELLRGLMLCVLNFCIAASFAVSYNYRVFELFEDNAAQ